MSSAHRRVRRLGPLPWLLALAPCLTGPAPEGGRKDVVIADFEGDDLGGWEATGGAFGKSPARGTLPGQMEVSGYEGRGLASSFHGGDDARGTLTSPPFAVERPYLNVLIGGGAHAGETCLNLLVGGKVVRTAAGPNDRPGGSERLEWASWDVAEFVGKTATLQAVDRRGGGWGHVSVDQIVQADRPRGLAPAARELAVSGRYLILPVANDAPVRRVRVAVGGKTVDEFDIKLADTKVDFQVSCDLASSQGKTARVETRLPSDSKALDALSTSDEAPGVKENHGEARRPQLHFTSRRGWLNDPNGLVFFEGEYHLFYQHNPYGWDWGNMHWGHAVSPDLVHWAELPEALTPRAYGDWAFSGSAVVDRDNTSGFGKPGGKPPLVLAYTSTGRGECIAYSHDRGRTWTEFAGNPVVKHAGRDPRLLWHAPTKRWVMALYDEEGGKQAITFHTSPDLKTWTYESRVDDFFECPDLFELSVEGEGRTLWVLSAADGKYLLGKFDGRTFTPEAGGKRQVWYGNFYAAQTFSDTPDGRRVQVGWARDVTFPGMPFNQQMTVPVELTLRPTAEGVRMFARPVAELDGQFYDRRRLHDPKLKPGETRLSDVTGDLFAVRAEVEVGPEGTFTLAARGLPITYDAKSRTLDCGGIKAPLASEDGRVRLHVLIDRGSVEVFGNGGRVAVSRGLGPADGQPPLAFSKTGAETRVKLLEVDKLHPAWR